MVCCEHSTHLIRTFGLILLCVAWCTQIVSFAWCIQNMTLLRGLAIKRYMCCCYGVLHGVLKMCRLRGVFRT